jgi:hypothetical protein
MICWWRLIMMGPRIANTSTAVVDSDIFVTLFETYTNEI